MIPIDSEIHSIYIELLKFTSLVQMIFAFYFPTDDRGFRKNSHGYRLGWYDKEAYLFFTAFLFFNIPKRAILNTPIFIRALFYHPIVLFHIFSHLMWNLEIRNSNAEA